MYSVFIMLFPFIAAMFYGLGYILIEKIVGIHMNTATFLTLNTITCIPLIVFLVVAKNEPIEFSGLMTHWRIVVMIMVAALAPSLGWLFTIHAIKNSSALYTAFAETSYPVFTIAFGFLIFGMRQMDFTTFIGGLLIMMGAIVMIYGQSTAQNHE